jgi:dienelactone hydrolase
VRLLFAVCVAACSSQTDPPAPAVEAGVPQIAMPAADVLSYAVDKTGPFKVGHRSKEISYTPPGQPARKIVIEYWYPSLDAEGDTAKYLSLFTDAETFEGASLAPPADGKSYPVHVYSHGSSGFPATSFRMARYFASHGWLYVAPTHLGNTLGSPEGKDRPFSLFYLRSMDVTASLDTLVNEFPKARVDRVVMSGHSFGAYTTWATMGAKFDMVTIQKKCDAMEWTVPCKPEDLAILAKGVADPRVIAGIPMAGGNQDMFNDYDAPKKPVLLMSGTDDVSGQGIYDKVTTLDLTWLEFTGGCHQLFAMGGCAKFDEKLGWALTNTHALAFARRLLLGDKSARTEAIVKGIEVLSDKIVYRHKGTFTEP